MRISRLATLVALVMVALSAMASAQEPVPVKIGYAALRINLPVFVAQERGFFKKHGLDVTLERFDTAQPCVDALISGRISVGGYAALPISYAAQERSKVPLMYMTEMLEDKKHPFSFLIVKKDSPLQSLADLKGKRIGILPTIAYKIWLEKILAANGITAVIQNVAPNMQAQALATGQVDALWTNDPMATTILQKGVGRQLVTDVLCPKHLKDPFPFGAFTMRADFVRANPDAARRLAAALDESIRWLMTHQADAKQAMEPYVAPEQKPFVGAYADSIYLTTKQTRVVDFQAMADFYHQNKALVAPLDLTGLIYVPK